MLFLFYILLACKFCILWSYVYLDFVCTLCLKKISHLTFDINFGKFGQFSKFFHQVIHKKILYVYITKISTSPAICYYTTL